MNIRTDKKSRDKVEQELFQLQSRVIQTLVPTILGIGLVSVGTVAIGGQPEPTKVTAGATFAILFTTSLYIASLTFKIFMNAAFLSVFDPSTEQGKISWEEAVGKYRRGIYLLGFLRAESMAIGIIYVVLAATFLYMFFDVGDDTFSRAILYVSTGVLVLTALLIILVYATRTRHDKRWSDIKTEYESK